MPNKLEVGTSRVGDFFDFDPGTPEVKVTLERTSSGISLALPWSGPDSPYAGWFLDPERLGPVADDKAPHVSKPLPSRVLFHDSHGSVLLVDCWSQGFHANMFGPGSGKVRARVAVLDVDEDRDFEHPHGLRTHISGLREWLGITSWDLDFSPGLDPELLITPRPPESIVIDESEGGALTFDPTWWFDPNEGIDQYVLRDELNCTTRFAEATSWAAHLQEHRAVRDLLVLSRWRNETCVETSVLREDDPLRTLDGVEHGPQWRSVVVGSEAEPPTAGHDRRHLITYNELGPNGVRLWLSLREQYARALDPVISSIDLRGTNAYTRLAHTAPGLEALGYLLLLRDGTSVVHATRSSLRERLERILVDLKGCLPFDGDAWVTSTVAAYNGLKHANRAAPEQIDLLNSWRQSVLVTRAWVALELGVPVEAVRSRLAVDPQSNPFVRRR